VELSLASKLYNYGIRYVPHSWFQNYLKNRKQFTSVNGVSSDDASVTYGLPQGSVLRPILFLLYINDMPNAVTDEKLRLFADDTNLFVVSKTAKELNSLANIQLNKLNHWLPADKLHLSIEKSSYTAFPSAGLLVSKIWK
jgi:retron-type reverse transcriptase